jgi:hypothetical protein
MDPKCLIANGDKGRTGAGLNKETILESQANFNMGVDITGDYDGIDVTNVGVDD